VENGLLRIEVVMQDRTIRRVFGEQPGLFDVLEEGALGRVIIEYGRILKYDMMKKHIIPCLNGITSRLTESLMDTGKLSEKIFLEKEIILDVELLRNALKKWYELWDIFQKPVT
jgi:hypothetical protein